MKNSKLDITAGGGLFLTLFGLPFLFAGLAVLYAGFMGKITMEGGGQASVFFYLPFGGLFATVGAGISFGRSGRRLDRMAGTLTEWWGFLFLPLTRKTFPLDDYGEVDLRKEVVRSNNSSRTVYRVYLAGPGGSRMVDSLSTFLDGRRGAEKVAKFLQWPMRDSASGSDQVRQPEELDMSLREIWKKEGKEPDLLPQPVSGQCKLKMEPAQAVFQIPPTGFGFFHIFQIGASLLMLSFVLFFFLFPAFRELHDAPGLFQVFFFGFILLFTMPLFGSIVKAAKDALSEHTLTASQDQLHLRSVSPLGVAISSIPMHELEELELVKGAQAVEARSDLQILRFGAGLPTDEVTWLKSTLEYIIFKGGS